MATKTFKLTTKSSSKLQFSHLYCDKTARFRFSKLIRVFEFIGLPAFTSVECLHTFCSVHQPPFDMSIDFWFRFRPLNPLLDYRIWIDQSIVSGWKWFNTIKLMASTGFKMSTNRQMKKAVTTQWRMRFADFCQSEIWSFKLRFNHKSFLVRKVELW